MPDKVPVKQRKLQAKIRAAKIALDLARRMGDPLRVALTEDALNDLLDRYSYHTYHGSKQED